MKLYPGDPGYEWARNALIAKAAALGFRLATAEERAYLAPSQLYSFSDADGTMVAPVFVRIHEKERR